MLEQEAAEVLSALGAPPAFLTPAHVRFINDLARGHPLLLVATSRYMQRHDWQFSDEGLLGLFCGDHTEAISDDVLRRVLQTVEEPQRDLLYRLALFVGSFTPEDAAALASVPPTVDRARERLSDLIGSWVQRDADHRLLVSPLVSKLGPESLPAPTRAGCHLTLADRIVRRPMTPVDAQLAVGYYHAAGAFDKAGTLFLALLAEAQHREDLSPFGSLLAIWSDHPLPRGMDLGLQLCVRSLQLVVFSKHGRSVSYLTDDIDRLLLAVTERDNWAVACVAVYATLALSRSDFSRVNQYLRLALRLPESIRTPAGEEFKLTKGLRLEDLIWGPIAGISTAGHLREWLETVALLPPARRQGTFGRPRARLGCMFVADELRVAELRKPAAERRWDEVLSSLNELAEQARLLDLEVLWAAAVRSRVIVQAEHQRQLDTAAVAAQTALEQASSDPDIRFLIAGELGRQFVLARRYDRALPLLEHALRQESDAYPHGRMLVLLAISQVRGKEDPDEGVRFAREAVELAQREGSIPPIEAARATSELGLALFLRNGVFAALDVWARAAELLFASKNDGDEWKELFAIFAHTTTYFTSLATSGRLPAGAGEGSLSVATERGRFLVRLRGSVGAYDSLGEAPIQWLLAEFAAAAGNDTLTATWLARAAEQADRSGMSKLQATATLDMIPSLVVADRHPEALDLALKACQVVQAFRQGTEAGQNPLGIGFDVAGAIAGLGDEERAVAESGAVAAAVIPAALRICMLAVDEPERAVAAGWSLAALCRQILPNARNHALWTGASEILELAFGGAASPQAVIHRSNEAGRQSHVCLHILGYLCATVNATVEEAFPAHAAIMGPLCSLYPPGLHDLPPGHVALRRVVLVCSAHPDAVPVPVPRSGRIRPCEGEGAARRPAAQGHSPGDLVGIAGDPAGGNQEMARTGSDTLPGVAEGGS